MEYGSTAVLKQRIGLDVKNLSAFFLSNKKRLPFKAIFFCTMKNQTIILLLFCLMTLYCFHLEGLQCTFQPLD